MQDRFKFRIWDIPNQRWDTTYTLSHYLDLIVDYENYVVIQQCLGVKDKTGRLIYEGDLLLDIIKEIYETYWYSVGFHLKRINSKNAVVTDLSKLEIIASIADNKLIDLDGQIIGTLTTVEETLNLLGV